MGFIYTPTRVSCYLVKNFRPPDFADLADLRVTFSIFMCQKFETIQITLWQFYIATENGHLYWVVPLKIVILHSYICLPEGNGTPLENLEYHRTIPDISEKKWLTFSLTSPKGPVGRALRAAPGLQISSGKQIPLSFHLILVGLEGFPYWIVRIPDISGRKITYSL